MTRNKRHNPERLAAINEGIEKANSRAVGAFDGLHGSLPEGTAIVLNDIVAYLREYLFDERGFSESQLRKLLAESLPPIHKRREGFRSVSKETEDEGMRVALGVLNSIASVLRVRDGQITPRDKGGVAKCSEPLSKDEAVRWLFSGEDGLNRHRYLGRQRATARRGAEARSEKRQDREHAWQKIGMPLRTKHPEWSNNRLAQSIARSTQGPRASISTIRQAIPKLGLAKKT